MKILFALNNPGFVRFFDTTVEALVDRGHTVRVSFTNNEKKTDAPGLEALANRGVPFRSDDFGERSDIWKYFLGPARRVHDALRYLDVSYADSVFLRRRYEDRLPAFAAFLKSWPFLPKPLARPLRRAWGMLERLAPTDPKMDAALARIAPDLVVVSPLLEKDPAQAELVRSARAAGIPTVACIASWDNLTTKGLIYVRPDRLLMWNATQADEAVEYHAYPRGRIALTGAQSFDRWFDRTPEMDRDAFTRRMGLPAGAPYVLFTGSSAQISDSDQEMAFIRQWAATLRRTLPETWRDIPLVVRPHPLKFQSWAQLADPAIGLYVFPAGGANAGDEHDRTDYFHSLCYAAAVVGLNTSAMVEAAVLDKPVLTILAEGANQRETLHFRYLLPENGGHLFTADSLEAHAAQLATVLSDPTHGLERTRAFVERFIRPRGRQTPAISVVTAEIEAAAAAPALGRWHVPAALRPLSRWIERGLPKWAAEEIALDADRAMRKAQKAKARAERSKTA